MKILFIGARLFNEVAGYAKEKGIDTILTESNKDSPNLKLANKLFIVPRGMDSPVEIALSEDVDAVVPLIGIDKPLIDVAKMKELLEKEYNLPVVASNLHSTEIASDKLKTKKFFQENNIKTPEFFEINRKQFLKEKSDKLNQFTEFNLDYPSVLKQSEGQGGSGIKLALCKDDACDYFKEFEHAFVEKFVKGIEVSVEVLSWKGQSIALTPVYKGETTLDFLHPLNKIRTAPAEVNHLDNQKLRKLAEKIVAKMGASGTIEVEFIFDPETNELNVIEMNTRPSGTRYLTLTSSGINPLQQLVDMGTGHWDKKIVEDNMKKYSAFEMPLPLHRKKEMNEIFSKGKKDITNNHLFSKNRPWILHGHEKAQRITIRAKNSDETIEIAKKLKIVE
ncbi:ATP-grasp domain-containing protein [Methanobacterium alcaliphilum]|uniref:ATP-grasp domain-containing protein n=1 Tax=Methanobacterium alcaliphilum TaxID=392018 RepID=UPI00200AD52E|nr:ATP-grasp domain-containing protein [Methanobacterium alcaliphilum]MCK9152129.1 ATP-grasp domain-containing protein [Methanobacterium alcaliphilum]